MAQTKVNKTVAKIFTGAHAKIYKLSGGRIGDKMAGGNIILLGTTGRKSGDRRERPLIAGDHDDGWVVIASWSGHDSHPAWYLNLEANPECELMVGAKKLSTRARVAEGEERERIWKQMAEIYPPYNDYQKSAGNRTIPVVVLDPV